MTDHISEARFARIERMLAGYCARREIPGALALVQRKGGEPRFISVGAAAFGAEAPLARDSLFRIGSMSKPIVSVAALSMLEEGAFRLSDPIAKWLPEFAHARVLAHPRAEIGETVPAKGPILVEDLLTHRPGFATPLVRAGPLNQAMRPLSAGLGRRAELTPDEWIGRLAELPLTLHPGEGIIMGFATDVLGVMMARIAGKPLPDILEERVLGPLGMAGTRFDVPPADRHRLVPAYKVDREAGRIVVDDPGGADSRFVPPPSFPSGSGGLVSTVDDYARFGLMLRAGGVLDGRRILARPTVALMTTDFLTPAQRAAPLFGAPFWLDRGFGLGVYVVRDRARNRLPASVGQYGWPGVYCTMWFNDPAEDLTAVMLTQVSFGLPLPPLRLDFETMVYAAIDD